MSNTVVVVVVVVVVVTCHLVYFTFFKFCVLPLCSVSKLATLYNTFCSILSTAGDSLAFNVNEWHHVTVGKDATGAFYGGKHNHSDDARKWMKDFEIGSVGGDTSKKWFVCLVQSCMSSSLRPCWLMLYSLVT